MATLNNPVNRQNIVDRFADFVVATANAGIVWTSSTKPFTEFPSALLDSSASGKPIAITGTAMGGPRITASTIYNTLVTETNRYTSIRNLNARLLITTGSGNRTRPAGDAKDLTQVAHLAGTTYQQTIGSPANNGVAAGQQVSSSNLEQFFNTLRSAYSTARSTTTKIDVSVCHSSCHASCHASRGRR